MNQMVKNAIERIRITEPWLHIVEHDMYGIGERLRKIEDGYFVVFNIRTNRYQVHSAYNGGHNTFAFVVPFDELDSRTIDYCEETRVQNAEKMVRAMELHNKKLEEQRMRDFRNKIESASLETADDVSYAIDKDGLHSGYKRTFGGVTV